MANDLIKEQFNALLSQEDVDMILQFDELEKRVKVFKDSMRESFKEFLIQNNLTDYSNGVISVHYKKPSERVIADVEKMKADCIYDDYTKKVQVKDSVSISVEYEE